MNQVLPTIDTPADLGVSVEIKMADGIFVKSQHVPNAGTILKQHVHAFDHLSMIAFGSVLLWAGDEYVGQFQAPKGIQILAGVAHTFQTLEPDTLIYCIHNIKDADAVVVLE